MKIKCYLILSFLSSILFSIPGGTLGKTTAVQLKNESIIYGKIVSLFDVTGVPKMMGISASECNVYLKNIKTKTVYSIYLSGNEKDGKYFAFKVPSGDYELSHFVYLFDKMPLIKKTNDNLRMTDYFVGDARVIGGATMKFGPTTPSTGISVGGSVSASSIDYTVLKYPRYVVTLSSNTVNYLGTIEFHYTVYYSSYSNVPFSANIIDEKSKADEHFNAFKFMNFSTTNNRLQ